MLPTRFVPGHTSAMRRSRLEGKQSLLPKPRRPGSTDRLSVEARRPSTTGLRSSSAEPPRVTIGVVRLSREASATKIPFNRRSKSQQSERYGQVSVTPLRTNQYPRPTTTPQRTPSGDRFSRSWETSLERALAFVTIKDQRPLATAAWQRAAMSRATVALGRRGLGAGLLRPLTIARFVELTRALLDHLLNEGKLNTDNYVAKLPHLSKRLLYPGTVSKSWLKTVNTLHAFPQALGLIVYLLDLLDAIEAPVSDEWLYVEKDELACLRREYLRKCWIRFQVPGYQFEDLNQEHLEKLKQLLGYDEERVQELMHVIQNYETQLEDEAELAARAEETRLKARLHSVQTTLRNERATRRDTNIKLQELSAARHEICDTITAVDKDIERAQSESRALSESLQQQSMSVSERGRLLDDADYMLRVRDSKLALADQIAKMIQSKETELALWQNKTLDSCVEYNQGLIHLTPHLPEIATLAIDERELMGSACVTLVSRAADSLRARVAELQHARQARAHLHSAGTRQRARALEEARKNITELKSTVEREQKAFDMEVAKESAESESWKREEQDFTARREELNIRRKEYARVESELEFWEKQELSWRTKLSEMHEYLSEMRDKLNKQLQEAKTKRTEHVAGHIQCINLLL